MERKREKKARRISLRTKWIFYICTTVFLALAATVIFNYITINGILKDDTLDTNKSNAKHISSQIGLNLDNYKHSIEQLANIVTDEVKNDRKAPVDSLLKAVKAEDNRLMSVYYMDFNTGKLHISPYMDYKSDVRDTRTYKELSKEPATRWMDVYQDTTTKKIMTSVITPIMVNDKMVGALGYDIDLSTIGEAREQIEGHSDSKIVILDPHGFVVSSFIKDADGKNLNPAASGSVDGVEDVIEDKAKFESSFGWVSDLYKNNDMTAHDLTWDGNEYSGQITAIPEADWKVISFSPKEVLADKTDQVMQTSLWAILIGLLIGLAAAYYLAGSIKKIFANLQGVLSKTAKGDLMTPFTVKTNDEIGDLSDSYNDMLKNMRGLVSQVNGKVVHVNDSTARLSEIASENSKAITEVSKSVEEIAVGATNQSEGMEQGANSIHKLSQEIETLNGQSQHINLVINASSEQLDGGKQQVEGLKTSYQELESSFEQVTEMVRTLNNKSMSISKVTQVISQIAEQTNLLALNASIEAARAGEHGKGFAVVADEVRTLAEESKKASLNIHNTITSILDDTNQLVNVMNDTNTISQNQKSAVTNVDDSFAKIAESLQKIQSSLEEEATSISQIDQQKNVVVEMIENVSAVSQQTSASSEEIAAAMEEQSASSNEMSQHMADLSRLIEELSDEMKEFKIK
nr:methyl-accepting chemotaxis protein [Bacillus massiliglaciei]